VDGVLTDGRLFYGPEGAVTKVFDTKDGLGIELARAAGLKVGLLTGRADAATEARARELKLDAHYRGRGDKAAGFAAFLAEQGVAPEEVAYAGDDLPDLPVLSRCGLAAAPADAAPEVRAVADLVLACRGGHGAVRELVERILKARGDWRP
jgi:3-deoxy-D-manno-octulosonate 8-phosphate phosphatase (KDO 8-P phosphatase)